MSGAFEGVYLVGGAVRDVLMGEPNFDVDIAVEGDGIALGKALAEALGGRVVPHDRFGTAIVVYDGGRVDVATARTEFYDSPARAAHGGAGVNPPGPLPARLHDQCDGRFLEG